MRILQVSDSYRPATGGLERTVAALSRELAARGHQVELATLSYPGAPDREAEGAVTVHRLDGWTRYLRRFAVDPTHQFHPTAHDLRFARALQRLVDRLQPEVMHVHGWALHSCLALRLPDGAALVVTLHDYSLVCAKKTMVHHDELDSHCPGPALRRCLSCATGFYGPLKGPALVLGLAEARRRLDRVAMFLPISAAVAQACLPGIAPERIELLPSFVADDVAAYARSDPRPEFLPDGPFVLFVGALGEHKGLGLLARAHRATVAEVPLVVVGPRRADTALPEGTARRPVIVRHDVPHRQIMASYRAAAAVVVPSRWPEPQGLVAVEAMATGAPVVVSDVGGLGELVRDGATGLVVPPGDETALARALDRLLGDPAAAARMGAAAVGRAEDFFASAVLPRVEDAYRRARDRGWADRPRSRA